MLTYFRANEKPDKNALRAGMRAERAKRRNDPAHALAQARLLESAVWLQARAVALYVARNDEAATAALLEAAWSAGKLVFLPKVVNTAKRRMEFFRCRNFSELASGYCGIMEPQTRERAERADLMITPGLAFDGAGWRLGYGGGYYDRFLAACPHFAPALIGLCHDWQIIDHLPHGPLDLPVNGLCSESGLKWL